MLILTKRRRKAMVAQLATAAKAYNEIVGKTPLSPYVLQRDRKVIMFLGDLAYELGEIDGFLKVNAAFSSGDNAVTINRHRKAFEKEEAFYGKRAETVFVHEVQR